MHRAVLDHEFHQAGESFLTGHGWPFSQPRMIVGRDVLLVQLNAAVGRVGVPHHIGDALTDHVTEQLVGDLGQRRYRTSVSLMA